MNGLRKSLLDDEVRKCLYYRSSNKRARKRSMSSMVGGLKMVCIYSDLHNRRLHASDFVYTLGLFPGFFWVVAMAGRDRE